MPGEHIEIKGGKIYIDGRELVESPELPAISYSDFYSVDIPEDHYYVLGDNRPVSGDSRLPHIGTVPRENIIGKVWIRYWPPSKWGLSPGYSTTLE